MRSSTPTSLDVAKRAGVSRSIVSGVLNGTMSTMRVSEETRARILEAARELGYTPNPVAQALRRQRSNVICYVPRSGGRNPYDAPVPFLLSRHLARASATHGYHIVEAPLRLEERADSDTLLRFLVGRHVDGVVLDSPHTADEVTRIVDRGMPMVQMIRPQSSVHTPTVGIDPSPGITEAIDHLVDSGHSRIAFIGKEGGHPVDRDRLDAFRRAMAARGIPVDESRVMLMETYHPSQGLSAVERIMAQESPPTAMFIAGDNLASGALQHFYRRGIRIPDDISVVSYDDLFAGYLVPPLTSVSQPLDTAAERAVALLIDQITAPSSTQRAGETVLLPSRLTRRESVRSL